MYFISFIIYLASFYYHFSFSFSVYSYTIFSYHHIPLFASVSPYRFIPCTFSSLSVIHTLTCLRVWTHPLYLFFSLRYPHTDLSSCVSSLPTSVLTMRRRWWSRSVVSASSRPHTSSARSHTPGWASSSSSSATWRPQSASADWQRSWMNTSIYSLSWRNMQR